MPVGVLAGGPGDNGGGQPTGGPTSNVTIDGSKTAAASIATMSQSVVLNCDETNATTVSGTFTLNTDVDAGSTIVIYLVPNNGSNATPEENVAKNFTSVDVEKAGTYNFSISVTQGFTVSAGGILAVFAVNSDGTTVISSSKSNSLNCTEATPTPTPTATPAQPTPTPTATPGGGEQGATPTPTATPGGNVSGATGTPVITLPPTDTAPVAVPQNTSDGWRIVLLGLAAILATVLLLTPVRSSMRRR